MTIGERYRHIRDRIDSAASGAKRDPADITLVAVSKTFPAAAIMEALAAGVTDLGENRVQEARAKHEEVTAAARWHLVGHLQSNKARDAVGLFDVIESVDSIDLAARISRESEKLGKRIEILLQVNVGGEEQKNGVAPSETSEIVSELLAMPAITLRGLMTIPPIGPPASTREHFRRMRSMFDELRNSAGEQFSELSMGMSDDFEIAIEEGATIVRIGRAIFGGRG